MWEILVLAALFILAFGVAIYMVTRTRKPEVIVTQSSPDIEKLVQQIAEAVAKQTIVLPRQGEYHVREKEEDGIEIDESIIPVDVELEVSDTNLDEMAKEEVQEDSGLGASRDKLAKLKRKK